MKRLGDYLLEVWRLNSSHTHLRTVFRTAVFNRYISAAKVTLKTVIKKGKSECVRQWKTTAILEMRLSDLTSNAFPRQS